MFRISRISGNYRFYSIKQATKKTKKYTDTINLPKTKFPNRLTSAKRIDIEAHLLENSLCNVYSYQELHKGGPTFVLHDGPPYANGELHMGHAINKILKDITLRQHVIHGQKVNYIPGWDCHGLPIELKATNVSGTSTKSALSIRQDSRKFALEAIESQMEDFRNWGILSNWKKENIYLTINPDFIENQIRLFYQLYDRKLVYRALKPVYWSPSSKTALAEAELEYDQHFINPAAYIRFELQTIPTGLINMNLKTYALVWTTTPWTLPSNQAICYNETLNYAILKLNDISDNFGPALYLIAEPLVKDFAGVTRLECEVIQILKGTELMNCNYKHPIKKSTILPFIAAPHVQDCKGTGLVHTAPAHGPEDFLVSIAKNLPVINYVDETGCYTNQAPDFLIGKNVLDDGNKLVLEHIAQDVIFVDQLEHAYPIDWRTKQPVIIRASEQWFINTEALKERALEEIDKIEFYPRSNAEACKKALITQVRKRPFWCISRQRAWGVPIPVFYQRNNGQVIISRKLIDHICGLLKKKGDMDFWWTESVNELLPQDLLIELQCNPRDVIKGSDIFDIWFDSGSSWYAVLKDKKVADLYVEGYDQFTGWFQSSLLTSIAARDCAPFRALFVHGFTVDEFGHKMSKSLGNVISPKDIIQKYGTDALRWWVASHGTQHMSITVSDKMLQQATESLNKIRSTLRYLNGVIGEKQRQITAINYLNTCYLNRYLLNCLVNFEEVIEKLYRSYEYNRVVATIQNFVANQISAVYVHLIKDRLYCGTEDDLISIRFTLLQCYGLLCKALWPITPFLVEESWSYYDINDGFYKENFCATKDWKNASVEDVMNTALDIKRLINQQAGDVNSWTLAVRIKCNCSEQLDNLCQLHNTLDIPATSSELCEILQVGNITLCGDLQEGDLETNIELQELKKQLCPRCRRYTIEPDFETCARCREVLKTKFVYN